MKAKRKRAAGSQGITVYTAPIVGSVAWYIGGIPLSMLLVVCYWGIRHGSDDATGVALACLPYLLGGFAVLIGGYSVYAARLKVANRQAFGEDCFHVSLVGGAIAAWAGVAAQLYPRFQENDDYLFLYVYVGLAMFTCGAAIRVNRRNPRTAWRTAVFWLLLGGGGMVLASALCLPLIS